MSKYESPPSAVQFADTVPIYPAVWLYAEQFTLSSKPAETFLDDIEEPPGVSVISIESIVDVEKVQVSEVTELLPSLTTTYQ